MANKEVEFNIYVYIIMFMIYSTLGAIAEHLSYFFSNKKKLVANPILPGFPLYGLGAYIAIIIDRNLKTDDDEQELNIVVEFLLYAIVLTLSEYSVGRLVGAGRHHTLDNGDVVIKTWSYQNTFLNIDGIINFRHFVIFGILGLIVVRIHKIIVPQVNKIFIHQT